MIIAGPGVTGAGSIRRDYLTVMDLAPTFLELAGVNYPDTEGLKPILGESMVSHLADAGKAVHDENYTTIHSHRGRMLLRQGDWKLTNLQPPFDEAKLELFNLSTDPGETQNLRESEPEKFRELLDLWRVERKAMGIVLPEDL